MSPSNLTDGPSDNTRVGEVWFLAKDYQFLIEGLKGISDHFTRFEEVKKQFDLKDTDFDLLLERIKDMIGWGEDRLKNPRGGIIEHGVTYGSIRLLKAGGMFLVHKLERQREEVLARYPDIPRALLSSIDEKIVQFRDRCEKGVMNGLRPADIFFEVTQSDRGGPPRINPESLGEINSTRFKIPPYLEKIPIMDEGLKNRCFPLIASLDSPETNRERGGEGNQLDTIVREMSVILEDRIRKLAGLEDAHLNGIPLMAKAFGGPNPPLVFSLMKDIQESAHHLYRGYSGFVRNEVMHSLVTTYSRERVIQLLGLVDYLLFLLTQAERKLTNAQKTE